MKRKICNSLFYWSENDKPISTSNMGKRTSKLEVLVETYFSGNVNVYGQQSTNSWLSLHNIWVTLAFVM